MSQLDGISYEEGESYCVFYIDSFTEGIKNSLRKSMSEICYGGVFADSKYRQYNYKNTIKEFLKRYEAKKNNTKKGLVGELLVHLLIKEYFDKYETVTPFFNMEERSIKKGYDLVLADKSLMDVWLIEVKSGELHKNKDENETMEELINIAKRDLKKRLNEENQSLWQEAIYGARAAYKSSTDLKDAVIDILESYGEIAVDGIYNSKDKNIFAASVLFSKLNNHVSSQVVANKQNEIDKESIFNKFFLLAIQKETYQRVYEFLKNEADE